MEMYFEDHGTGPGRPLILVPAALSGIRTSYGVLLPLLARRRRVVAIELPGHGRTPDCDGPYTVEGFAAEVVHLLDRLGLPQADVLGWGLGAAVALRLGTHHPARAGRLVLASPAFDHGGLHPGLLDGAQDLRPEHLYGSELHEEYLRTAPDPAGWHRLVTKMAVLDADPPEWTAAQIRALRPPRWSWWATRTSSGRSTPSGCSGCSAAAFPATSARCRAAASRSCPAPRTPRCPSGPPAGPDGGGVPGFLALPG